MGQVIYAPTRGGRWEPKSQMRRAVRLRAQKEEAEWTDSYARCNTDYGDCNRFDTCLPSNDERRSAVCATPCETVDDCLSLAVDFVPKFTAEVECIRVEGKGYCVLNCSDGKSCDEGAICVDDRCTCVHLDYAD